MRRRVRRPSAGRLTEDQTLTANTGGIGDARRAGRLQLPVAALHDGGATWSTSAAPRPAPTPWAMPTSTRRSACSVSYTDGHGTAESADQRRRRPVANVNDAPTGVPTITGTLTEDQTLTANTSRHRRCRRSGRLQLPVGCSDGGAPGHIGGATASTYTLGDADVGAQISVQRDLHRWQRHGEGPLTSARRGPGGQRQRCAERGCR